MKKRISRIPKIVLIVILALLLSGLALHFVIAAGGEELLYTTLNGIWVQVDENTWTMDTDQDGETDITLKKIQNEWKYLFHVKDPTAQYYAWEESVPDGYEVSDGVGERRSPAFNRSSAYSHTTNVDDAGKWNGAYLNNQNGVDVISIPGAESLHITLTYQTQGVSNDWVCMWEGNQSSYTPYSDYSSSLTGKLGGAKTTKEYDIKGDTVTFGFRSDGSTNNYYGYYAVVEGTASNIKITNQTTQVPTGNLSITKKVEGTTDPNNFKFTIKLSSAEEDLQPYLSGSYTFGDVTFTDGVGVTYLKDGESVSMSGIPAGLKFTIEEETDGYTVSWEGGTVEDGHCSGTIQEDTTEAIICTNMAESKDPVQTQNLIVKKTVVDGSAEEAFSFQISFWNLSPNTTYAMGDATFSSNDQGMANVSFALKDGEEVLFSDLPVGTQYKVNEAANDYVASYQIENGSTVVQQKGENLVENLSLSTAKETVDAGESAAVHFTNTRISRKTTGYVTVSVQKIWKDCENQSGIRPDHITVHLLQDGDEIASARLDKLSGWKTVFDDLEEYHADGVTQYEYTVQETSVPGYTTVTSSKETEEGWAYTITNTALFDLSISKNVEGSWGNKAKNFRFQITLQSDSELPGTLEYENDGEAGNLQLTDGTGVFTLSHGESITLKNIPAGVVYQIEELNADGYTIDATNASGTLAEDTAVSFTNTKNGMIPTSADTNAGILLILLISAAGVLRYIRYRKNKEEKMGQRSYPMPFFNAESLK